MRDTAAEDRVIDSPYKVPAFGTEYTGLYPLMRTHQENPCQKYPNL